MATPGVDLDIEALLRLRLLASSMRGARKPPRSPLPGAVMHQRRGRGLEVYDIRAWSDGDDIRHLDRNVTARTGVLHVRAFRDERERAVMLVADFRESMMFGTRRVLRSVAGAEAIIALGWRTIEEGGSVGLLAATAKGPRFIGRARGPCAMVSLIGELAAAHRAAHEHPDPVDPPLADVLEEAEGLAGESAIIAATALDAPGDGFDGVAERLARKRDLCVVLVADRIEIEPVAGAYPYRTLDGDAGWLRAAAPDARVARLRRLGVSSLQLDAALDAEAMVSALEQLHG
ncbi:DUF58 domain-containing protein [Methylocella sp.]|jgi:uncharacterized protein (DUF58 family)|uniref:DUF58 domain-containing protein n=1 Tax=Methylocella sp. TaxID=1978226 RepID=UPI003C23B88F